jgi:hypothetical protein
MGILSVIGGIVVVLWILGLIFSVGGELIHLLLVAAVIAFIIDFLRGRDKK